jgi:hypothetical protein
MVRYSKRQILNAAFQYHHTYSLQIALAILVTYSSDGQFV